MNVSAFGEDKFTPRLERINTTKIRMGSFDVKKGPIQQRSVVKRESGQLQFINNTKSHLQSLLSEVRDAELYSV
ncbi:hypothetical protein EON65_37420 [archaeon]|nr:MAG: hypothetical protein EON65_37420 [archaeon]